MTGAGDFLYRWIYEDFWCLIWPNAGAMPLCATFGFIGCYVFRDHIGRKLAAWLHKHHAAHLAELERERNAGGPAEPRV
jgi:hypothetical protein